MMQTTKLIYKHMYNRDFKFLHPIELSTKVENQVEVYVKGI